jgi:hypothetical protein
VLFSVMRDAFGVPSFSGVFFPLRPSIIASYVGSVPSVHYLQTPAVPGLRLATVPSGHYPSSAGS